MIRLFVGIGMLILSLKLFSENIKELFSNQLNKLFSMTSNKVIGIVFGTIGTAIIQSSTASTVLIVSFVDSNVIDLYQATSLIMGANIGSTITAQIMSLERFDISLYLSLFVFIGMAFYLIFSSEKIKKTCLIISSFGLLFVSLSIMNDSMVELTSKRFFAQTLAMIDNPILLIFIGICFTIILQSSAALTSIIITMINAGVMIGNSGSINPVLFVILGSNIGSCITSLVSSIGTSTASKRAAMIHLLFNVFGCVIFGGLFLIFDNLPTITLEKWFKDTSTQIAMFHTIYNVISTIIFYPFINKLVNLSKFIIKDKKKEA